VLDRMLSMDEELLLSKHLCVISSIATRIAQQDVSVRRTLVYTSASR
jgi:hypothetical protein